MRKKVIDSKMNDKPSFYNNLMNTLGFFNCINRPLANELYPIDNGQLI